MNPQPSGGRKPYKRPMAGWWRKNPYFVRYMLREATALGVAGYAVFLLTGLIALAHGEAAYGAWVQQLQHPLSIAAHLFVAAVMCYHTWTWFEIMPKTMPPIIIGGKRVADKLITWTGMAAAGVATLSLYFLVRSLSS